MLALSPEPGELRCFGLDRIADLSPSPRSLVPPASFDAAAYYAQAFGIIRPDDEEPQEIVLSLTLTQGRYVQTFPLHSSQRLPSQSKTATRISLRIYRHARPAHGIVVHGRRGGSVSPQQPTRAGSSEHPHRKRSLFHLIFNR